MVTNSSSCVAYRNGYNNADATLGSISFSFPSSGGEARKQWHPEEKCANNL
jgi:hypothetical protein